MGDEEKQAKRPQRLGDYQTVRTLFTAKFLRGLLRHIYSFPSGVPGYLKEAEIDTAHFMGNFPESVELHAIHNTTLPAKDFPADGWTAILPRTKVGPHRRHFFQLENVYGKSYTHVRVTIHPDGGLKRVRLVGVRAESGNNGTAVADETAILNSNETPNDTLQPAATISQQTTTNVTSIPILPLTPEAFAPFGNVIQAYTDHNAAPRGTKITPANQGTASKFHKLALPDSSYTGKSGATTGVSVYRCDPLPRGKEWDVKVLERHPYTTQAFIPMGGAGSLGKTGDGLDNPGNAYLVVVAKTGMDDQPDLKTLRAFVATAAQGIMYNTAVWRKSPFIIQNTAALMK